LISSQEKEKKQIPLRLSPSLWEEVARWAEDEFRSVNGQIEYILSEAVKNKKRPAKKPKEPDVDLTVHPSNWIVGEDELEN
jgi:hypothetical protein